MRPAVLVVLFAFAAQAATTTTYPVRGVSHQHTYNETMNGVVQDFHLVKVDVSDRSLRPALSPEADKGRVVSALAQRSQAAVAINGSFFSGTYAPCGVALSNGTYWTSAYEDICDDAVAFSGDGRSAFVPMGGKAKGPFPTAQSWATQGLAGVPQLIKNGVSQGPWTSGFLSTRAPRTVVAVSQDQKTLLLLVVDGRRTGAAGMTGQELVTLLIAHGAYNALNLDGGGSSTLWVRDEGGVQNKPSDGRERVVSNALLVLAAAADGGVDAGPGGPPDGGSGGSGGPDAGPVDGGPPDGGDSPDASGYDAGTSDGGETPDAGEPDGGPESGDGGTSEGPWDERGEDPAVRGAGCATTRGAASWAWLGVLLLASGLGRRSRPSAR